MYSFSKCGPDHFQDVFCDRTISFGRYAGPNVNKVDIRPVTKKLACCLREYYGPFSAGDLPCIEHIVRWQGRWLREVARAGRERAVDEGRPLRRHAKRFSG
jgi:hypothetical protein